MGRKALPPAVLRPWEASFSSRGLIFGGEEISIPETRPIRKSYIYQSIRLPFDAEGDEKFLNVDVKARLRQYT